MADARRGGRWQVGLGDLSAWVLAAGVAAGVLKGSTVSAPGLEPDGFWRGIDLALATIAVGVVLVLCRGLRGGPGRSAWAIGWRLAAAALLTLAVGEMRWLLGFADADSWRRRARDLGLDEAALGSRLGVAPALLSMTLVGVVLAVGGGPAAGRRRAGRLRAVVSVVLAAAAGLAIVVDAAMIPYFVLLAIQAVRNAMIGPTVAARMAPGVSARIVAACPSAAISSAALLAAAAWLAGDARRGWSPRAVGPRWVAARVAAIGAVIGIGGWVVLVEFDRLDPFWTDGLRAVFGRVEVAAVALGFGVFASGLAARGVAVEAGAEAWRRPAWARAVAASAWSTLLVLMALATVRVLVQPGVYEDRRNVVIRVLEEVDEWAFGVETLRLGGPGGVVTSLHPIHALLRAVAAPDRLVHLAAVVWVALAILDLAARGRRPPPAPLDEVAGGEGRLAWFLWLWLGLWSVCLAAMPVLTLAAVALIHLTLHGAAALTWGR